VDLLIWLTLDGQVLLDDVILEISNGPPYHGSYLMPESKPRLSAISLDAAHSDAPLPLNVKTA
jgi:hypothetical protein